MNLDIDSLKRLSELEEMLKPLYTDVVLYKKMYEDSFKKWYKVKKEYETLDADLAEGDGRKKVVTKKDKAVPKAQEFTVQQVQELAKKLGVKL